MYELEMNAESFKMLLKIKKIKQYELAEIIGMTREYLSEIVNGREVSKSGAFAICKAISADLEIDDLFTEK